MASKKASVIETVEGAPDTTIGYTAADGSQQEISAGSDGSFDAKTPEEAAVLHSFDFKGMKASAAASAKAAEKAEAAAESDESADAPAPEAKE